MSTHEKIHIIHASGDVWQGKQLYRDQRAGQEVLLCIEPYYISGPLDFGQGTINWTGVDMRERSKKTKQADSQGFPNHSIGKNTKDLGLLNLEKRRFR